MSKHTFFVTIVYHCIFWTQFDLVYSSLSNKSKHDLSVWKRNPSFDQKKVLSPKKVVSNHVALRQKHLNKYHKKNYDMPYKIGSWKREGNRLPLPLFVEENDDHPDVDLEHGLHSEFQPRSHKSSYSIYGTVTLSRDSDTGSGKYKSKTKHRYRKRKHLKAKHHLSSKVSLKSDCNDKKMDDNKGSDGDVPVTKSPDEMLYHQLSPYSIESQMLQIATMFPEANFSQEVLGQTVEYNNILLVKVTETKSEWSRHFRVNEEKYVDETPEKKIVLIVHGLSFMGFKSMPCFSEEYQFDRLLGYYLKHLENFDIFIIPLANPDGLSVPGFWNKNNSPQAACPGVALDRNFDVAWKGPSNKSSCSQQYPGTHPFSEPESKAVRSVFHRFGHKIIAYFHVHAGTYSMDDFKGDAVLYPKGYTDVTQSNIDHYIDLKGEIDEAMKNASFRTLSVTVDTLHNWYGTVTGTSVDYASSVYGVPYSLELVMQIYSDDIEVQDSKEMQTSAALIEVWQRVIDVIFKNINKSTSRMTDQS